MDMQDRMMQEYQEIRRNGRILVDIDIPQVNTRILNLKAEDGTIYYVRLINGKVYDLIDMAHLKILLLSNCIFSASSQGVPCLLGLSLIHI